MEKKHKHIAFALLFGIFALLIFVQMNKSISKPALRAPETQTITSEVFQEKPLVALSPGSTPSTRSSITITRYPRNKMLTKETPEEALKITPAKTQPTPSASSSTTRHQSNINAPEPTAGITKTSKRPPPERIQELNEQGIIIW